MITALRLAFARRAFARAYVAYDAYQTQPAGAGWRFAVADALHIRLLLAERRLAALMAYA
jgi:hypothetical protein